MPSCFKFSLVITFLAMTVIRASGQEITRCDLNTLGKINSSLDQLTEKEIDDFLLTFDSVCDNNVEYSEFSNELLFKILNKYPELLLSRLQKIETKIDTAKILMEFGAPVNDAFDINTLIEKAEKSNAEQSIKKAVIKRLTEAKDD